MCSNVYKLLLASYARIRDTCDDKFYIFLFPKTNLENMRSFSIRLLCNYWLIYVLIIHNTCRVFFSQEVHSYISLIIGTIMNKQSFKLYFITLDCWSTISHGIILRALFKTAVQNKKINHSYKYITFVYYWRNAYISDNVWKSIILEKKIIVILRPGLIYGPTAMVVHRIHK